MQVLQSIPAPAEALLGSSALAHVITINPDGSPQVSVVWCGVDQDVICFCSRRSTAKIRNLTQNPGVILSIEDTARNQAGTQQHLVIHGTATVVGPANPTLCDELCRIYTGVPEHPSNLKLDPTAVTVAVTVERIGGVGPWAA